MNMKRNYALSNNDFMSYKLYADLCLSSLKKQYFCFIKKSLNKFHLLTNSLTYEKVFIVSVANGVDVPICSTRR